MRGKHVQSENIIKKIICIVLIIMTFTSNLMTPLTIIANEYDNTEIMQGEEENKNDEELESDIENIGLGNSENGENEEVNPDTQDDDSTEDVPMENQPQENIPNISEDDKNSDNQSNTDSVRNETQSAFKANNSLLLGNSNNNVEKELTPQELEGSMKATTKEDIEELKQNDKYKTKNDDYEIRIFETQFLSGASKDENGNLVWTANNTAKGHEFTFRVNYALSGYGELPAGSVQITIPKQILRNRAGNLDDYYIMSLPTLQECEEEGEMAELIYKEDGDYLVIYNPQEVEAGLNGYFEISYATNSQSYEYIDYNTTNTDLIKNGGTASDDFFAIIALNVEKSSDNTQKETLNNITSDKNVFINTTAILQSTQKRYPTIFREWNPSWKETTPADANDYYYLVWEIRSYIEENPTQKFNFTLEDVVTDLTTGTSEGDYELVGYKLAGERYYSDKNTQTNQTTGGYRYDYVLTRHKKSVYVGKTYKLKNTITAIVDPIDQVDKDTKATSSNTFNWDPHFDPPVGHFTLFKYGNNNWYKRFFRHWDYANYDLDKLQNYEETGVNELKGFKYYTETEGYAYPWTIEAGASSDDPYAYGKNPVTYDTWDDTLYLEGDKTPMNYEDYYLEYYTYSISNLDAEFDDFYQKLSTTSPEYEDDEVITFYAKFGDRNEQGGNEWVQIGTYNLKTKVLTPNTDYVAEMTASKITFKDGVHATGWRFTTSNKHYYTSINVTPYFVLTNSDYVKEKVADKSSIKIENDVSTNITNHNGDSIFSKTDKAFDYARVTYYDSEITKEVASVANKVTKKKYTITWKVNAWENATSGEGEAEYIKQDSGKFYDLIPLGGEIDTNTIQVETEKGFLPENEYSYEVIANYKNGGRAMLIVTINAQAEYYNVYYTTTHSWESMKDFGRNVLNPVAYETGNEKITHGYADNGGNLSLPNKVLMNELDSTTDDKKFLYAERTYNINALTAAISGLHKKVKNSNEADYSYNSEVGPDETYSYKLRFENTFMNSAKNLVFFDSLENFKVIDTEAGTEKTSGWHGTLTSIDLTQLKQKGIDAKVYISTQENLDLESHNDLTDNEIWILATEETDLSTAKAIAIDMTKTTEGENFVLASGDSVTATLYMQAPDETSEEIEQNQYTYNNVYMKNTLIDELDQTVDYFIHQDYTTVKYHVVADIPMRKVNAKDENEGIKGITFRLKGTSIYGNDVDENITSPDDGYITFKSIEAGEYILQEYEGTPDWVEDHTEHIVNVNIDRSVYIDDELVTKQTPFIIRNESRAHTDVTIYKKDLVNKNKVVEGAKFKLSGTSDYGNEILMYGISDSSGKVTFEDIEKGTYMLTEVSTVEGYTLNDYNKETFRVVVDENSNYDVQIPSVSKKYSHTPNIDDNGIANGNYPDDYVNVDTVTIPGASKLKVTIYYSIEDYYDGVSIFDNTVEPTFENLEYSISGQICDETFLTYDYVNENGYENVCSKIEYTIDGDTVSFLFTGDSGEEWCYYGYYAIIEGDNFGEGGESIYNNGEYDIYNEPLHSFSFIKKDLIDKNVVVPGVTFKVAGTSDYGNYFEKTAVSDKNGKVTFDGLEKGTYTLTEIDTPSNYVLNTNVYTVTIDKMNNFTISGSHMEATDNGYEIYNEPKHNFYFTKKDKYNNQNLGGAKFRLYGTSNIGNTYDETVTSVTDTGFVTFDNLESGTYILKEIEAPNTSETSYILDEEAKVIEVFEDGKVTLDDELIWPLSERNENDPYIWYNTRNKGQITITKKWVDNLDNSQRQEPKIYVSTMRGELAYSKVYFRTADDTHSIIDYVTSENVTAFKRNTSLSEQEVLAKANVTRLDNDYSNENAEYKIYAWEENGTVYWWTKADRAVLPANLDYYFQNETGLTDINWSTIYRNGFWAGTPGSETIETSVTNMQNMFYGCTSMVNLDISIINNSAITEETKANMQYAFGNNGSTPEGAMTALKYITVGDNFKLFDTSVLPEGKWKNQTTNEKTKNTDLTGTISAGTYEKTLPIELIGQSVNYVTSLNGVTLDNWKVFDVEDGYVYLIYGDYMPNSAVAGRLYVETYGSYMVYTHWFRKTLMNAMTTKSNWSQLLKGTINGTAIDYTTSTDTKVYANGSPTLELWIDSWNKVYPDDKLYTAYQNNMSDGYNGNYVGTSPNPTSWYIDSSVMNKKAGYSNRLYYPDTGADFTIMEGAREYWLASPSAIFSPNVMSVHCYGTIQTHSYDYTYCAFRPIVCLPSSVLE